MSTKQDQQELGEQKLFGSCLCGSVRFELSGPITLLEMCHCNRCKKVTGPLSCPRYEFSPRQFSFTSGESSLQTFRLPIVERPPPYEHVFCSNCGSPMPFRHKATDTIVIPAGALEDDPSIDTVRHIYVEHESSWYPLVATAHDSHRHKFGSSDIKIPY